ncbi:TetR/AcrR family transcriptional regulator [Streptomyces marincola]|uniref:TetR/AcrR family transcriptional regulator n=1 Tax=Streptomyces marincola TaxID=2878388 RepID=UPI001CF4C536|nr:TetR/AcrR family transcriptional regulator [Streptomyces marincola]UCM88976.1 TetR/AcrR family transcriptional regulator [Streptomyces marincola]
MRADARRNYERLLTEADAVFSAHGTDASLESVARRAGVAIGTLYGHFPTRRALLEALLRDRHAALFRLGERLRDHDAPGDALGEWVTALAAHGATYNGLAAQFFGSLDDETSELHAACLRMREDGERLVARAVAAGAVRAEVTASDVFALIAAAAWLRGQVPGEQADRLLRYLLDGLARG